MKRTAIALVLLLAGCGGQTVTLPLAQPQPTPTPVNLVKDDYKGRFRVMATVLENQAHGPQLCQAVAESLPPQCGGPDIVGWKWDGLPHESVNGTKWGSFILTGTFDGKSFTLTEPAKADDGSFKPFEKKPDFTSPCPGPLKPVDLAKATDDAMQAANALVAGDPDFGGLWIDQTPPPTDLATPANDPAKLVLNIRFTKDLKRHETEIRKVWGGALCLSLARHTEAELQRIQDEVSNEPGMSWTSTDVVTGTVEIGVFVAREGRQRELDTKYGVGLVTLYGTLQPID